MSDLYGKDVLISFNQGREDDRDEAEGGGWCRERIQVLELGSSYF